MSDKKPASAESDKSLGRLVLDAVPPSEVRIDGQKIGHTPLEVAVPTDTHTVTFVNAERGEKIEIVDVDPSGKCTPVLSLF